MKTKLPKKKKKTTSQLKKELDKLISEYVRKKYADRDGFVRCYTCGLRKHWKELDCGHYISRSYLNTRFDEDNLRPQCKGCNIFGGGKVVKFGLNLEKDLGKGIIQKLYQKAQKIVKDFSYQERIDFYKEKLNQLSA